MIRPAVILLVSLLATGATTARPARTPLSTQGFLAVYAQPFQGDASRLRFRIETVSAVREDGTEVPLAILAGQADRDSWSREIRLSSGDLAPGRYTGLAIRIKSASMKNQAGSSELTPPAVPVQVESPFRVVKQKAVVLTLEFRFKGSIGEDDRFSPVFFAAQPDAPAIGAMGLVTSPGTHAVTIFNKASGQVAGIVPTPGSPAGMALDSPRRRAYVAIPDEDALVAVGLLENAIINRTRMRSGDRPSVLALTPDGELLLSANSGSSSVSVIDASSLIETDRIPVGNEPGSVLITPDGSQAYALNTASSNISVINIATRSVVRTIATQSGPFWGQFSRAGESLYVIHRLSPYVTVIDPPTFAVRSRVLIGVGASALLVHPQTDLIYLSRRKTNTVDIYDPLSLLPIDSFPTAGDVAFLGLDEERNVLYLSLPDRNEVRAVEVVGHKAAATTDLEGSPWWIVVQGAR